MCDLFHYSLPLSGSKALTVKCAIWIVFLLIGDEERAALVDGLCSFSASLQLKENYSFCTEDLLFDTVTYL